MDMAELSSKLHSISGGQGSLNGDSLGPVRLIYRCFDVTAL